MNKLCLGRHVPKGNEDWAVEKVRELAEINRLIFDFERKCLAKGEPYLHLHAQLYKIRCDLALVEGFIKGY